MSSADAIARLRHDLANPLAALLAEAQLLLLNDAALDDETRTSVREIERLAIRMRGILRESGERRS
jgi:signal transduction histidine kinase